MLKFPNINYCWGSLIVEELVRNGAAYCGIAPGSRSAPLAVPAARHPKLKTIVHFDERGLAFHAMGAAAASHQPAALICTSGTAAANFLPAIVEASKKKVPLIVFTADRPPELRQTGAVQTIDQVGIFGKYVVWQTDMPCPDMAIKPEVVLTTIDQAVHQAVRKGGVVHINCMFREPLYPEDKKVAWGKYFDGILRWSKSTGPYTSYSAAGAVLSNGDAAAIASRINAVRNGVIVAGKIGGAKERLAVLSLAKRLGWPVIADIASGLRLGHADPGIIHYFDQAVLKGINTRVDGVIHVGGRITSKRYYEFIQSQAPSEYIMVLNHALRNDPTHQVTMRVESTALDFCAAVSRRVKTRAPSALLKSLTALNRKIHAVIDDFTAEDGGLNEISAARLVTQLIPKGTGLYLANSMPIRDMDMYADYRGAVVHTAGNRGASGIDGLIASAAGYAQGLNAPVTLVCGDLAALHDINSLAMLKDVRQPVVLVIVNNGGGGIFSFLPIAQTSDVFERCFGTPHPFMFSAAAAMFELNYHQPQSVQAFTQAYMSAIKSQSSTIIEVMTGRGANLQTHRSLQARIKKI